MYYYLLYLLGYYTYDEEIDVCVNTLKENQILKNEVPLFPSTTTIIKNRELIIDKEQLRSSYKDVVLELKERIRLNPDMIK